MVSEYDDLQMQGQQHWRWWKSAVRLPNDTVPPERLDGPCRTYRLGRPMKLRELEKLPPDLQRSYLRRLRHAGATRKNVSKMLGISQAKVDAMGVRFDKPDPEAWADFMKKC